MGRASRRLTPHLRCGRYAPLALRAQHPLSRQLRLNVKRPEWQLPRQSGFAGPDAVADANRCAQAAGKLITREKPPSPYLLARKPNMSNSCLICERINLINKNENPYHVCELETGHMVIGDFQYFKGYTLFLCKQHVPELHMLEEDFKIQFLTEMSIVAEAVYHCFKPDKLNYELLGNSEAHMHWHLFPRFQSESDPNRPVWCIDKSIRYAEEARLSEKDLQVLKERLLHSFDAIRKGKKHQRRKI
jgi:diadenosine tetraphosphate (Ap4A) HIT family hydrolase